MVTICWSKAYPGVVELVCDDSGKVVDLKLVKEDERQPTTDDQGLEVEEGVVIKNGNCEEQLIDCESESG
jgi:hypothetical protein